ADKLPKVAVETPKLALHGEKRLRILDSRGDFEAVADDAGVGEQRGGLALAVAGDFFDAKAFECAAIVFAFRQHDGPAQSGLRTLECQQLEQSTILVQRHAPLDVVVGDIERLFGPRTTRGAL